MSLRLTQLNKVLAAFKDKIRQNNLQIPKFAKIVEVGPRDGLQNEKAIVPLAKKIEMINKLSASGLQAIEATSFVSPKWIPQMADHSEVYKGINMKTGISYPVLVPNLKGFEKALEVGVQEIAVFGSATESFSKKNINCSIEESFGRFKEVLDAAKQHNIKVRGYVSCVLGCPYEGEVDPQQVNRVAEKLYQMGCYEISLGDTIGIGTPEKTHKLLQTIKDIPKNKLAGHFHDTHGNAIENIFAALEEGIAIFDSSTAGLGGCPYSGKPTGNVSTETVLYALKEIGVETGVDLAQIQEVGRWIAKEVNKQNLSVLE